MREHLGKRIFYTESFIGKPQNAILRGEAISLMGRLWPEKRAWLGR